MTCHRIAFITPTKDRPEDLRKMLLSLAVQSRRPDQVIVVDASAEPVESVCRSVDGLHVDYIRWTPKPSAAAQRNGGVTKLRKDIDLVCFFDDDQVLHPDALKKMMAFWQTAPDDVGAASFNQANHEDKRPARVKRSFLSEAMGLYCSQPGKVAPSGWQSLYGKVEHDMETEWLSSQAIVVGRKVLDEVGFDEFFDGYSYLEDLDFSYSISRRYKLAVVANARFDHFHSPGGRTNPYEFGKVEVRNRLYFVRKHALSVPRCYLGMLIRCLMTLYMVVALYDGGFLKQACGNVVGICMNSIGGRSQAPADRGRNPQSSQVPIP